MDLEYLITSATTELVVVGIILAALAMAWMFTSGFIDKYGAMVGMVIALGVGTVLPSLYILFAIRGM